MAGSRHENEAHWRKAVEGQPGSGLGIRAYCRERQQAESAFYYWRRRLREEAERSGVKPRRSRGRKPRGER